jgi:hypothetical protein
MYYWYMQFLPYGPEHQGLFMVGDFRSEILRFTKRRIEQVENCQKGKDQYPPIALQDGPLVTHFSIQKPFKTLEDSLLVRYSRAFSNFLNSVSNSS